MKQFKPLFIPKVDYTDVPHHHTKGWNGSQKRYINRIYLHNFDDERRLIGVVENTILQRCQWLVDYMYENADDLARLRPTGTPSDKVNSTKLLLAIGRVAQAKVRKDWGEYTDAILLMNTLYIYALEFRYGRECGYTDDTVVIGDNKHGWRKQSFNPDGKWVDPKARRYGRYQSSDK